jgi:ribonuclease Z
MMNEEDRMIEKSFLIQKYARLGFGSVHLIGYSVAGEESVVQVPELNVCFDIGRCPYFALTSDYVCLTHGHMDHLAGLPYYLSQRAFQGMKAGTVVVPRETERGIDGMLRCWREVERQGTPYQLVGMSPDELWEIRKDFGIRAVATHHGGPSLGYILISIREKLKPEYMGKVSHELAQLRKEGVQIQYRIEVPLVAYLGDTCTGPVFDHPDVQNAEILITEVTFFEPGHHTKAKAGKHLHLEHFAQIVPKLKNKHIVISHVSRRIGIRKAKALMRKKLGDEQMERITFLMDFEGSTDAGDVESTVPPSENE